MTSHVSDKLPGDAEAAGPRTTPEVTKMCSSQSSEKQAPNGKESRGAGRARRPRCGCDLVKEPGRKGRKERSSGGWGRLRLQGNPKELRQAGETSSSHHSLSEESHTSREGACQGPLPPSVTGRQQPGKQTPLDSRAQQPAPSHVQSPLPETQKKCSQWSQSTPVPGSESSFFLFPLGLSS